MADARRIPAVAEPFVVAYLKAKAFAEAERKRVNEIEVRVLAEIGRPEVEPGKAWLKLNDEESERFFARLNEIHYANGFEAAKDGYCPALTAESDERDRANELMEAVRPITGITVNRLLCGVNGMSGLKTRDYYLDLLVKLVTERPGFDRRKHGL